MNPINVPTPKTVTGRAGIPLELLLAIENRNVRNVQGLPRLFPKDAVMQMTARDIEVLIRVASGTKDPSIRPYYAEFRQLVIKMIGGAKRLADDVTRLGIVERTATNKSCIEHARSVGHIFKNDEFKKSETTPVVGIRVQSCIRIARLALAFHRHELPFITGTGLPLDTELGAWTGNEIFNMQHFTGTGAQPAGEASDDSYEGSDGDDDDDAEHATATTSAAAAAAAPVSASHPPPPQKAKVAMTYQHPYDRSPAKPRQTEAQWKARRDSIIGSTAAAAAAAAAAVSTRPMTVPAREFVPSPSPSASTTTTTKVGNKHSAAPTKVAAASRVLVHFDDDRGTSYDGAIADLIAAIDSIDDESERGIVAAELEALIAAADAERAARKPDYGVLTKSINALEASLEHAGPAEIESINARIASLKKAATRLARTGAK